MTITLAEEDMEVVLGEVRPLLEKHWEELALYQDAIPLDPEYDVYVAMHKAGMMSVFTARDDGNLIGYAVYIMRRHLHYRQHTWALADLFWLHPDHRRGGVGNQLFAFIEGELRLKGVDVMHTTVKTSSPAAGFLLRARGHVNVELGYSLRLK